MALKQNIDRLTKSAGHDFDIIPSVASGDYRFLLPYIKEKKVTDVVIAGGDGTISQVVGVLRHTGVNFGIIPCGSGNGLAWAARLPRQPEQAISLILQGNPVPVDAFEVNSRFACMLCGLGFDAKVAHDFATATSRGLSTYVRKVVKNFFSSHPHPFTIQSGDQHFNTDAFFVSVANSDQFGNHFTIAPKASLSDGLLDVVIVTRQSRLSLLWQTWRQVRGINHVQTGTVIEHRKGVVYFQASEITITNHNQAPFHIDGDPAPTADRLHFSIIEKAFRLHQPPAITG